MTRSNRASRWRAAGVRVRLGLALALALLPVLILSGLQSALIFQRDAADKRADLVGAALRGAAQARSRIEESQALLRGLATSAAGYQCVTRLADIESRLPGYANLIRFNTDGWVTCSAAPVPVEPDRRSQPWFQSLVNGDTVSVATEPQPGYAAQPALLASVRVDGPGHQFAGVLTAVLLQSSLLPKTGSLWMPPGAQVAIVDLTGRYLSTTGANAFPVDLAGRLQRGARQGDALWLATDRIGETRLFTSTPLVGGDLYLVLSAPSQGVPSWTRLNPISAFLLPILAFTLALAAVWWVAEQGIVRWIVYLRRIAALYARGRYSVRPLRAVAAPAEIRDLADTFGAMAATIAARDAALKESLAAKDDLMREIHHRVKNNLQVISSLLNLQQRTMTDPAAEAAMRDTRQRIVALGLIYRALYEGPDLKRVDLRIFLNELVAQLLMDRKGGGHAIQTELNIDPLIIDPDRLAPLALFIVEAITHVCNHLFPAAEGLLSIDFRVHDQRAELVVGDTGVPSEEGDKGRTMMAIFARQLGGVVTYPPRPGGLASIHLNFPLRPDPDRAAQRKVAA